MISPTTEEIVEHERPNSYQALVELLYTKYSIRAESILLPNGQAVKTDAELLAVPNRVFLTVLYPPIEQDK